MPRRRVLGLFAAAAGGLTVAGCGTDRPPLADGFSTGQGRAADTGPLDLRNIVAVSAGTGVATLLTTIFNNSATDDFLLKIAVKDGTATIDPPAIRLPAGQPAVIGMDTSLAHQPGTAVLRGAPVKAGYFVQLTFVFERAAPLQAGAIVVEPTGAYAAVPLPAAAG